MEEVNTILNHLLHIVENMEFIDRLPQGTLHSKMEQRNRTITKIARCMLQNKSAPHKFWSGAVFTSVYLLNRSPTMVVKQKTPKEAWSRRKLKAIHLKVFGSIAYTWIRYANRTNLDSKSKKPMITRYNDSYKAYMLVDIDPNKVSFSRGVVVDEEVGLFQTSPEFKVTKPLVVTKDSGSST